VQGGVLVGKDTLFVGDLLEHCHAARKALLRLVQLGL
jgi:hypothetical protein